MSEARAEQCRQERSRCISFERNTRTNQEGRKERDRTGLLSPLPLAWEAAGIAAPRARVGTSSRWSEGRARARAPSAASSRGNPVLRPAACHSPRSSSGQRSGESGPEGDPKSAVPGEPGAGGRTEAVRKARARLCGWRGLGRHLVAPPDGCGAHPSGMMLHP